MFGAPHILQSDNGRDFAASIITELKELWLELIIVHGKPKLVYQQLLFRMKYLQVLLKKEDLQAHLTDKLSDNAHENTNSNINSVDDNNSNDIPVPMDCEHECTI